MSVGRNDPCPCGSGKKFKKCCMKNNVVSLDTMISQELDGLQEELMRNFGGKNPEKIFEALEQLARSLKMDELPRSELELSSALLIMWIIFHENFGSEKTAIEQFIENKKSHIRPAAFSLIQQWADTPPSLSRIVRTIDEDWLEIEDYFTLEKKKVKLDEENLTLEEGDFLLGFLLPYGAYEKYFITFLEFPAVMADFFEFHVGEAFDDSDFENPTEFMTVVFPDLIKILFNEETELVWIDPLYEDTAEIFKVTFVEIEGENEEMADLGVTLWNTYCLREEPKFRKPEVYAAALHYFMSETFPLNDLYTQNELADLYKVSSSSIGTAFRKMEDALYGLLDESIEYMDERDLDEEEGVPFHPMTMDREVAALNKAIEGREFESDEELDEFIRDMVNSKSFAFPAETEKDRAQNLVYEAFEAPNRKRRRELAEQALELDENCIDAYTILGEEAGSPIEALPYFEQGLRIGERELGPEYFKEMKGHFWGLIETRPYMRARFNYAINKEMIGETEEAITHYEELLELNEQDNLGVRYQLFNAYVELGKYGNAAALLKKYEESGTAIGEFNELLLEYLRRGISPKLEKLFKTAEKTNPYVIEYLSGKKRLPSKMPMGYSLGSKEEAQIYVKDSIHLWPDEMIEWIKGQQK